MVNNHFESFVNIQSNYLLSENFGDFEKHDFLQF
jgi:hypothetical protein